MREPRILYVEPNERAGPRIKEMLRTCGFAVDWATSIEDADGCWMALGAPANVEYDVIVCPHDVDQNEIGDGARFLASFRKSPKLNHVILILFTGRPENDIDIDLADLRIKSVLREPPGDQKNDLANADRLVEAVEELLPESTLM